MSICVPYKKTENKKQAFEEVKKNITPEELAKWKVKASLDYDKKNNQIQAKGKGFEVLFTFYDNEVQAQAKMGLLLKPLQQKVLDYLERKMRKIV